MSKVESRRRSAPRKPPHRIIIARGEHVRAFTLRPWLAGTLAGVAVVFSICYFAATGYLIFRDDVLSASLERQALLTRAYEDRITVLRADIDRLTSRHLLNQEAFDEKLDRLLGRQAALDARQDIIAGLSRAAKAAGLLPDTPAVVPPPPKPKPSAALESDDGLVTGSVTAPLGYADLRRAVASDPAAGILPANRIDVVEASLAGLARDQVDYVDDMATRVAGQSNRLASVLKRLGISVPSAALPADAVGGPLVDIDEDADPEAFRTQVALVSDEIDRLAALRSTAARLPLAKPLPDAPVTSRFGRRIDPFLGRLALHTGIDFRGGYGSPVKATAGGKVIVAEYSGGYGKMVEVDHGNGITTRYGHLSRILVKPGQVVEKGTVVGRIGSTGRSTGPHLHYEIRVNGNAIDPMRYLKAGGEVAGLL